MINRRTFFKQSAVSLSGLLAAVLCRKNIRAKAVSEKMSTFEGNNGWCVSGGQLFAWNKDGTLSPFPKKRPGVFVLNEKSSKRYLNYKESKV